MSAVNLRESTFSKIAAASAVGRKVIRCFCATVCVVLDMENLGCYAEESPPGRARTSNPADSNSMLFPIELQGGIFYSFQLSEYDHHSQPQTPQTPEG